jgi:hypothetical protein
MAVKCALRLHHPYSCLISLVCYVRPCVGRTCVDLSLVISFTSHGAYELHISHRHGSIVLGKQGHLVEFLYLGSNRARQDGALLLTVDIKAGQYGISIEVFILLNENNVTRLMVSKNSSAL